MNVPFYDLARSHSEIEPALHTALRGVLSGGDFILGRHLAQFESRFAEYCGVRHCVGVGNGFDAIALGLEALGVQSGDDVIVPSHTFIATWLAVMKLGARPVPVDVDPNTFNLDPNEIVRAITPFTRAIVPVHLYGQPAAMTAIEALAQVHGLTILEDAAQGHGALYDGRRVGGFGRAAAFSFYPGKNLGALGDGGAIVTNDDAVAAYARQLRNYGSVRKYEHSVVGQNSRLDDIQAAVLNVKLDFLDEWNKRRRQIAAWYGDALVGLPDLVLPTVCPRAVPVWHLYVIRSPRRGEIQRTFDERGIGSLVHYPQPCHLQAACASLGFRRGAFPVAESLSDEVLSLPMWPQMTESDVGQVVNAVTAALVS